MCKNEQKPELEPCIERKERRSWAHEKQERWSRSHVHEEKSSGAVSFLRRLGSPGLNCDVLNEK